MPHRLRWLPQNPRNEIFHEWRDHWQPMSLSEAGSLLKQWRNPQDRIQGQVETFLELVEKNRFALDAIKARLEYGNLAGKTEGAINEEMQTLEILNESAAEILDKITGGKLHSNESVKELMEALERRVQASQPSSERQNTHKAANFGED
ncbi:MAG: hypothetical protein ACXAEI_18980, partial [Candidatus Hodarchaeales archaeon]